MITKDLEYAGNKDLLSLPKMGFLAGSSVPSSEVVRCYDWAVLQAVMPQCVIGGSCSALERDVLHFLLKGTCPIIVVLARRMYRVPPAEWRQAIAEGRMLVIATSAAPRQSRQTAQRRNHYVTEISESLCLAGATGSSSLQHIQHTFPGKCKAIEPCT